MTWEPPELQSFDWLVPTPEPIIGIWAEDGRPGMSYERVFNDGGINVELYWVIEGISPKKVGHFGLVKTQKVKPMRFSKRRSLLVGANHSVCVRYVVPYQMRVHHKTRCMEKEAPEEEGFEEFINVSTIVGEGVIPQMIWVPYKNKARDYNDLNFAREDNDYLEPLPTKKPRSNTTRVKSKKKPKGKASALAKKKALGQKKKASGLKKNATRLAKKKKAVEKVIPMEEIAEVEMDSGPERRAGKKKTAKDSTEMEVIESDEDVAREKQEKVGKKKKTKTSAKHDTENLEPVREKKNKKKLTSDKHGTADPSPNREKSKESKKVDKEITGKKKASKREKPLKKVAKGIATEASFIASESQRDAHRYLIPGFAIPTMDYLVPGLFVLALVATYLLRFRASRSCRRTLPGLRRPLIRTYLFK